MSGIYLVKLSSLHYLVTFAASGNARQRRCQVRELKRLGALVTPLICRFGEGV